MTEDVRITRCTCDVCKRTSEVPFGEDSPLYTLTLPMPYLSETGTFLRYTAANVEVCKDCLKTLSTILEEHYKMEFILYGGLKIEQKGGAE